MIPMTGDIQKEKKNRVEFHPARSFFKKRIQLADQLVRQYKYAGIASELDAQVILCALIGAVSNILWPTVERDRVKYIETLVKYSAANPSVTTISIPILINQFPDVEALKILDPSNHECEVLMANQIDRPEAEFAAKVPNLGSKQIRDASYANILYKQLRCGLLHSYEIQGILNPDGWLNPEELHYSFHESSLGEQKRLLYLPYKYIREIAISVLNGVAVEWERTEHWEMSTSTPEYWWIEGSSPS